MKLSMHMIERWLSAYSPVSSISEGARSIEGVRLATGDTVEDPAFAYVGAAADPHPSTGLPRVAVSNGSDTIILEEGDLAAVFNKVLEAFDFYDSLERKMGIAAFGPRPEQRIVSLMEHMLGPTFIVTTDFKVIASSQNFNGQHVNDYWPYVSQCGDFPLDLVGEVLPRTLSLMAGRAEMNEFVDQAAGDYLYGIMHSYRSPEGELIGSVITSGTAPFTRFQKDLFAILVETLALSQSARYALGAQESPSADHKTVLSSLLAGEDVARSSAYLRALLAIPEDARFRVVSSNAIGEHLQVRLERELSVMFADCECISRDGRLFMLIWDSAALDDARLSGRLQHVSRVKALRLGVSNVFDDIVEARHFSEHAVAALEDGSCRDDVVFFHRVALRLLLGFDNDETRWHARHPVVKLLEEADRLESGDLCETLRCYLFCNCSLAGAAGRMHVHKNTIAYRLGKVRKLSPLDLEDDEERLYALLSLMIERP